MQAGVGFSLGEDYRRSSGLRPAARTTSDHPAKFLPIKLRDFVGKSEMSPDKKGLK